MFSIHGMRTVLHDKIKPIMFVIAVVMAVGIALSFGGSGIPNRDRDNGRTYAGGTLAVINGESVDRAAFEKEFQDNVEASKQRGEILGPMGESARRGQMFDTLVQRIVYVQAAKREGVNVSGREVNDEVDKQIKSITDQLVPGKGPKSDEAVNQALARVAPGQTIDSIRDQIRPVAEARLYMTKLEKKMSDRIDASDKTIRASYDEFQLAQITVGTAKRTPAEAEKLARDIVKRIRGGEDFAALAKQYSDDPYAHEGGQQKMFTPRKYIQKDFLVATSLKTNEISEPIKVPTGYTIVKVTATRNTAPKDLSDPKKAKIFRDQYVQEQANTEIGGYLSNLVKSAKLDIRDGELKAYMMLKPLQSDFSMPPAKKRAVVLAAIAEYQKALASSTEHELDVKARANAGAAMLYQAMSSPFLGISSSPAEKKKDDEQAKKYYEAALNYTESNDLRMPLAQIYVDDKQYDKATKCLDYATENGYDNEGVHSQALTLYKKMPSTPDLQKLIVKEQKWLADNDKRKKEAEAERKAASAPIQPVAKTVPAQGAAKTAPVSPKPAAKPAK